MLLAVAVACLSVSAETFAFLLLHMGLHLPRALQIFEWYHRRMLVLRRLMPLDHITHIGAVRETLPRAPSSWDDCESTGPATTAQLSRSMVDSQLKRAGCVRLPPTHSSLGLVVDAHSWCCCCSTTNTAQVRQ